MTTIAQRLGIELISGQQVDVAHAEMIGDYGVNQRLLADGEKLSKFEMFFFKISDEKAYDVLSTCSTGDALYLMVNGVQSATEARKFLLERGVPELKIDNSALASEMLKRRIPFRNFMRRYRECVRLDRRSEHLADAIEYRDTYEFRHVSDSVMVRSVLDGSLSLALLKELGTETAGDHVSHLKDILTAYAAGTTSASLDDIRDVIRRCKNVNGDVWNVDAKKVLGILQYVPYSEWKHIRKLNFLTSHFEDFTNGTETDGIPDKEKNAKCAVAYALATEASGYRFRREDAIKLYEAGVDMVEAANLAKGGATVEQAIAVLKGETSAPVASGWL